MSRTREGVDQFSAYVEEETGRGWRKLRRSLNGYEFLVYGSKTDDYTKEVDKLTAAKEKELFEI